MNTKSTAKRKATHSHSHDKDDFADLRNKEFVSKINDMRKGDNWTNWRYLAIEYLYLSVVIGLGFYLSVLWAQSTLSTVLFVPLAIGVSILIGIGQHRLVMLGHEASHFALFKNKKLNELASDWFCFYPIWVCLLYTSPSPRDQRGSRMPSSA